MKKSVEVWKRVIDENSDTNSKKVEFYNILIDSKYLKVDGKVNREGREYLESREETQSIVSGLVGPTILHRD